MSTWTFQSSLSSVSSMPATLKDDTNEEVFKVLVP